MEKMRYITLINLAAKFFFTVCIFYFVKAKDDLLLIPIFNSLGYLISAILSFFVLVNNLKLKFKIPNINDIKFQLIDGWSIFLTNLSISLYSISTPLVLGFYTNNETVAIFSGADKVIQAVKGLYSPFTQSLYPFISRKIKQNQFDGIKVVLKATMLIGVLMFMMSLLVYLFSEFIVLQLFGNQYRSSISVLKILSPLPFLIAISNIFGFQTSINLGFKAFLSRLYFFVGGISVFILFLMVPQFYENGAAITSILIEFIVLIVFIYYLIFKKNILRTND
jgi:PST family polysaccharide transporter